MAAATVLSSGPYWDGPALRRMEAAIAASSGTGLGWAPTDAATALSLGPPSERTAACGAAVRLLAVEAPSSIISTSTTAVAATSAARAERAMIQWARSWLLVDSVA